MAYDKVEILSSQRSNLANDWTPREALMDLLGRMDRGEVDPTMLVVCYKEEGHGVTYVNATPNLLTAVGLVEMAKQALVSN